MTRNLAKAISFIFHPLLIPTYTVVLLLNINSYLAYSMSAELQRIVLGIVFFTTFALPMLMTMLYIQKGIVSNFYMDEAGERLLPYLSTAIFFFGGYYLLNQLPIPRIFSWVILAAAISILLSCLINFKWKISIHMVAIGAVAGLIFSLPHLIMIEVYTPFVIAILLGGIIGTARLISGKHNLSEISSGYLLGFLAEWIVLRYSHVFSIS